jgi:hypothetical protein
VNDLVSKLSNINDSFVKTAVASVFLDLVKRTNYALAANTIAEAIAVKFGSANTRQDSRNLSGIDSKKKSGKASDKKKKAASTEYVTAEKWAAMTEEQMAEVRRLREAAGIKAKSKKGGNKQRKVACAKSDADEADSDDETADAGIPTNNAGEAFGQGKKKRKTAKLSTSNRSGGTAVSQYAVSAFQTDTIERIHSARVELDSHADTHALGVNCRVIHDTGRTCSVSAFADHIETVDNVHIVSGAMAWDDPVRGETFVLVMNESLWLGDRMSVTLLNPNQCRLYGVKVQDDPTHRRRPISIFDPVTEVQNKVERVIGELRRKWRGRMAPRGIPARLWDYGLVYEAELMSRTARGPDSRPGVEIVTGDSVDISEWLDFEFYQPVWYWHMTTTIHGSVVGLVLPTAWVLICATGFCPTVQHISDLELLDPALKTRIADMDAAVNQWLDAQDYTDRDGPPLVPSMTDLEVEEEEEASEPIQIPDYTQEAYDEYVGAELWIPSEGELVKGRVRQSRQPCWREA